MREYGLFEKFYALLRAEVAVALKLADADFLRVGNAIAIPISEVL